MSQAQAVKESGTITLQEPSVDHSRNGHDLDLDHDEDTETGGLEVASKPHADFLATFTPEEEKKIMRKVDMRIVTIIGFMSMVRAIDANNAAAVKVLQVGEPRNILKQLHMTSNEYNWVQTVFFIAYVVFEAPSNLLLKVMKPRLFQVRIAFLWGGVLACHAAVKNKQGLYAARFFLGVMEAGLFPGIITHLTSWYRTEELGRPLVILFALQNASGIVGSLLCFAISYMNGIGGLSAWQWVFLLEGLGTMALAGVVWLVLPDYPKSKRTGKWLTLREQEFVEARLSENAPKTNDPAFSLQETITSLKDIRVWSFLVSQLCIAFGGLAIQWYLPTITTSLGFAKLPRNQLLNIPPPVLSVMGSVSAYFFMERAIVVRPAICLTIILGQIVSFILLLSLTNRIGIYIALIFGYGFYFMFFIPFWAWRSSTLRGSTGTAFSLALQSGIAQLGGIVSPQIFQSRYAHNRYKVPFGVCAGIVCLGFVANSFSWYLTRNVEYDVRRIHRLKLKAKKEGKLYVQDDIKVFEERQFYKKGSGRN
ncbi:hypothetical protein A1O3_09662 [Capronia epimyces CBS 606.96]|uniref:Major facilitator superfamily (MFS) profile domain-containing protein n=1 Tax=Capronia epimyces CBS 606.96 TaxID=1182542 RepID=W9XKF6_9EURO|nr:uncharacterized protein A1O3_09662 [Capronia epimyces CBS 606.96]EXJ77436.1 hypothetical protein A1O3_09662 [Capronia epimyces CBS 606.96]